MKWEPDWTDIAENLLIGLMAVAAAAIFIIFCVCIWKEVTPKKPSSCATEINHTPARSAT